MKSLVLFDSVYGNTEKVARAIGAVLAQSGDVEVLPVTTLSAEQLNGLDLLVVGSPTQAFGPIQGTKDFLKSLPNMIKVSERVTLTHGSPRDPTWEYIMDSEIAKQNLPYLDTTWCFFGHTHIRIAYKEMKKSIYPCYENIITIEEAVRYLINPGSVGQPRDGDSKASFLIYDTSDRKVEFFRISYDIDKTCKKIIVAGLPIELAERLTSGW